MAEFAFRKLSFKERYEVIQRLDGGDLVRDLALEYGVHETTIRRIYRNKDKLLNIVRQSGENLRTRKVMRPPVHARLDSRLNAWFREQRKKDKYVTNAELMETAMQINKAMGGPSDFKASMGWLYKFKSRNGIPVHCRRKMKMSDEVAAKTFLEKSGLFDIDSIEYENVYNMAATVLFWKAFPSKVEPSCEQRLAEEAKLKKDRVTVGLCANVLGSHKLDLLFVHTDESARVVGAAPTVFESEPRTWLERDLFVAWYTNFFKPGVLQRQLQVGKVGKVRLVVDTKQGSVIPKEMLKEENFEILSLPSSTASILQPMDQGIIEKTKTIFRLKLLQHMLALNNEAPQFDDNFGISHCMTMMSQAWTAVSPSDIYDSWRKIFPTLPERSVLKMDIDDPLLPTIKDVITAIRGKEATDDDERKFLRRCFDMENEATDDEDSDDEDEDVYEPLDAIVGEPTIEGEPRTTKLDSLLRFDTPPNEQQMKTILAGLMSWSNREPKHVQLLVQSLHSYYEDKYKNKRS